MTTANTTDASRAEGTVPAQVRCNHCGAEISPCFVEWHVNDKQTCKSCYYEWVDALPPGHPASPNNRISS